MLGSRLDVVRGYRLEWKTCKHWDSCLSHCTSLEALEVNYDARIALLTQCRSQDTQPLLDRMQIAVLQDLDAKRCLHQQVTDLQHRSVLLEDEMATLMRRVGGIMNQQGTVNVQFQVKWPILTESASCSSSDNKSRLVAPRDDGKSPREQDWGPPGALLRLYIHIYYTGVWLCVH